MRIDARIEDISDGKLYEVNDMAKIDTHGCNGCSACCHDVGNTIVLNPYDMYQIIIGSGKTYGDLIHHKIELHKEDQVTLPNLKMIGETQACGFLDGQERCSIHSYRPSICRLFPLGRYYENKDFKYFFQTGECPKLDLSKVKVKKWIGIENYNENKKFILYWYDFVKALKWRVKFVKDVKELEAINAYLIKTFYAIDWKDDQIFYEEFYHRAIKAKDYLGIL